MSQMYNVKCATILMPCMVFYFVCIYIYVNYIGKVSPYTVYWQSVPRQSVPMHFYWQSVTMHFLLAKCPHAFCIGNLSPCIFSIGKVSPCILYWQSVPMHFLLAKRPHIFFILWDIFWYCETFFTYSIRDFFSFLPFLFSLFSSPFSLLPFLFSFLCVFSSCSCYRLDMEDLGDIQVVGNFLPH